MTRALSRKFHAAKARKRMSLPAPEYPPLPDYDRMFKRITVETFWLNGTIEKHVVELYPARGRRDRFRAMNDGKLWKEKISLTHVYEGLRKAR